jgi:hypothetical protein
MNADEQFIHVADRLPPKDVPIELPVWVVSTLQPPGCVWRFGTKDKAVACAEEAARRLRLRVLVVKLDPSEPEILATIVGEWDGSLPF